MNTPVIPPSNDEHWMAEALQLAQRGVYTTTPNPRVGCVIVDASNTKVGEGAHLQAGQPHAEVFALRQAKEKAAGATAYVTLEPCSHTGRTPPCTDALIKANVKRVVIANTDPNPSVDGTGIKKLRAHGIEVVTDVLADAASQLNAGFFKRMRTGKPYVRVKLAASLDGRTALQNGQSQWITSDLARRDVQLFRAQSCAIVTGSGTVLDDDPSLLVRPEQAGFSHYPDMPIRQPLRVVMDGQRELPPTMQLFNDGRPTWVVTSKQYNTAEFADTVTFKPSQYADKPTPQEVINYLSEAQTNDIWVEAGSTLAGAFIEQGLADELIVYIAPKLLGDSGLPLLKLPIYQQLDQAVQLKLVDTHVLGPDVRLTYVTG